MSAFFSNIIVAAIILIAVLIFVHELGHFLVGKLCKIGVEAFSIGFGPPILKFQYKETSYRISLIPLGGYVKFYGMLESEEIPENVRGKEFYKASLSKRALVVLAGPVFNIVAAIIAYAILGYNGIPYPKPIVGEVVYNSVAYHAGMQPGDEIIEINNKKIKSWYDIKNIIAQSANKNLSITLKRQNQHFNISITPKGEEEEDIVLGKKNIEGKVGIAFQAIDNVLTITDPESLAAKAGLKTGDIITAIKVNNEWVSVKFWYEIVYLFYEQIKNAVDTIYVKVKTYADKSLQEREYAIKIPSDISAQTALENYEKFHAKKIFLEKHLGLSDSQLTVGKADDIQIKNLILFGDKLISWNNTPIKNIYDLQKIKFYEKPNANLEFTRNNKTYTIQITLKPHEVYTATGNKTMYSLPFEFLGQLQESEMGVEYYSNPFSAILYGLSQTFYVTQLMIDGIWKLISGQVSVKALGGPILIAKIAGDSAKAGWKVFLTTIALISINLAILNLLPIPILDGGYLLLYAVEAIRRKPMSQKTIEKIQSIGIAFIVFLVVLSTYNDISRFGKSIVNFFVKIFK